MGKVELREASTDLVLRQEMFDFFIEQVPRYASTLNQIYHNDGQHQINVACLNKGEVIGGTIGGHLDVKTTYWNFCFVKPGDYRRQGIGSMLLKDFETRVQQAGKTRIECEIEDERVLQWFLKHDYQYQDRKLKAVAMNPQRLKAHFRLGRPVSLYKTF